MTRAQLFALVAAALQSGGATELAAKYASLAANEAAKGKK